MNRNTLHRIPATENVVNDQQRDDCQSPLKDCPDSGAKGIKIQSDNAASRGTRSFSTSVPRATTSGRAENQRSSHQLRHLFHGRRRLRPGMGACGVGCWVLRHIHRMSVLHEVNVASIAAPRATMGG